MPALRVPRLRDAIAAPPSASTIQIVEGDRPGAAVAATSVSGVDWKATRRPSGEKAGREPKLARRRALPPFEGTIQRPPRSLEW